MRAPYKRRGIEKVGAIVFWAFFCLYYLYGERYIRVLTCPTKFYLYQARGPGSVSQLPVLSDIFSIEYTCLKKNMNAFRPSEHPPDRGGGVNTFGNPPLYCTVHLY